jgi:dTDP-4-dehydrorhamnose reductase
MEKSSKAQPSLELWGGIECTRNRIQDRYFDQLAWSGHDRTPQDLDRIAALGIRTLRYPVLWECAAPEHPDQIDWSWADERLGCLRTLGIRPIVGLVHHGSGPRYTDLLDPDFAGGLANFARGLAQRFPWVEAYTPVNEPLTTARFSALYGHWHPHSRDGLSFARALLNQCRAVASSMQAIREVQPNAILVQTEDLGKTYSTPELAYQADFENNRRWLTYDLLIGIVDRHHAMGQFLHWLGISWDELAWFRDHPCPPNVIGINHYLTSERFLDDELKRYPPHLHGGNGRHRYVDVEAVRIRSEGIAGPEQLLREAWQRYQTPLAVTEAHLGCTREEQVRWLWEVWQAAHSARESGADVRAVTVWSMLGAFDWDSLMTRAEGHYESGVFDVRTPGRRFTAIAKLVQDLTRNQQPDSPVLAQPGWWRRPERLWGAAASEPAEFKGPPILITGATGTLGRAFARACSLRGLAFRLLRRAEMDIADVRQVDEVMARIQPWAVVNAAGYVRVDEAEQEPDACFRENVDGPATLALACARAGIPLLTFSSDLVFDGQRRSPYCEEDVVRPLGVYGRTKAEAELRVRKLHPPALVVRTSAFFSPWDEHNFVTAGIRTMRAGLPFPAARDTVVSPTYVPDLVHACLDLLLDGESGVWHLANQGETTWADFARKAAVLADLDPDRVRALPTTELGWTAPRPRYSPLGSMRGILLAPLDNALKRYFGECLPEPEAVAF